MNNNTIDFEKDVYAIYGLIDSLQLWSSIYKEYRSVVSSFNKKVLCNYLVTVEGFDYEGFRMFLVESNYME